MNVMYIGAVETRFKGVHMREQKVIVRKIVVSLAYKIT